MEAENEAERVRLHALIRGRVQGVGFREFTRRRAAALGLSGWVRNLPDGRVEAEVEGERPAVEELLHALRSGPRLARVEAVDLEWLPPTGAGHRFSIR